MEPPDTAVAESRAGRVCNNEIPRLLQNIPNIPLYMWSRILCGEKIATDGVITESQKGITHNTA